MQLTSILWIQRNISIDILDESKGERPSSKLEPRQSCKRNKSSCADAAIGGGKGGGKAHPRGTRRGVLAQHRNKTKPVWEGGSWYGGHY